MSLINLNSFVDRSRRSTTISFLTLQNDTPAFRWDVCASLSRKIYNDVEARIREVQTQMSQQNPEGEPVLLSTVEQNKNFEQVKYSIF